MIKSVLVIEDEQNVATFIKQGLEEEGYEVMVAYDGALGLELFKQRQFDLLMMDVILPDINGFDLTRRIRDNGHDDVIIIMLTALSTTDNIIKGLDAGADDYLVKPFKFKELLARIRALKRRKGSLGKPSTNKLKIADLELDQDTKTAQRSNTPITLTATEYRLLEYLMHNKNKVLSRVDILENVWDINFNMNTNVVDVYVNYLRNKIDKDFEPKLIKTVIRMGYIFQAPDEN